MSQTMPVTTATLDVPGANLYYEVRGTGPVLLIMPGGPADAASFRNLAGHLASDYTVVTYDPRGLSHSKLSRPLDGKKIVQIFADDVHLLVAHMTKEKAFVYASSGGATIVLELAARHSGQLDTIVSHEPPSPALLPDPPTARKGMKEVVELYRNGDMRGAMDHFAAIAGLKDQGPPPAPGGGEPTPEAAEAMAMMMRNMNLFFGDYMEAISDYEPDIAALRRASCRIVPAVGEDSTGELAHTGGLGLAKALGMQAVVFPGAHGGFDTHAAAFAAKLREVFQD